MTGSIYPEDAMPWVGLYVFLASLVCTLAMAADAFQGFRQRKLWFPCRFFTINAASLTLIAIAMKLPVDLNTDMTMTLTVSASRRVLQQQYKELHSLASNHQEMKNFSNKRLICYVKKYWMMAETGNPQFAIACSPVSSAFGIICLCLACILVFIFVDGYIWEIGSYGYLLTEYRWSMKLIFIMQSVGTIVGSIAPFFRCLTSISHFDLSKKWTKKHLNVFRVENYWTQTLQIWKHNHVGSGIPGRHCKKVIRNIRNMVLNFCIALQIMIVVICKTICLVPRSFLILFSCCCYLYKSLLRRFKQEPNASNSNVIPDMEEYTGYVLHTEAETKLSSKILRKSFNSITQILHESEEKEPPNLLKLLKKSTGFYGVIEFDNEQIPPVHPEEIQNCWSLVTVTLTAIALSLPNTANGQFKGLISSMSEGIEFVRHIEESLNTNGELVKARKAARHVWTDVEVYRTWLQIDLQKKARKGDTSKEILLWLGDEAVNTVIQFKRSKDGSPDHSLRNFIAASSMYRISQTILLHCNEQENWPTDEELFEFISTIIADLLCACFSNLPRVITLRCHVDAIEKREDSIRTAVQLLGRSKKILKILKEHQLPNLDIDSMGYIDKWHALPKNQIPNCCFSSARSQLASSSSSESIEITIV
ncbi:uncharacterized protein LOC111911588 isoform X1 [Lactuca sativa]|uniref:uncharacterized protein LOC111911588 isoform X1 n=1 Tax=Lactuca sativa TaxID=4236 RepID=UPI001C68F2E5|nr:uncharacterized protein LOC111911588 isoform X1 [Lactuca sativa]